MLALFTSYSDAQGETPAGPTGTPPAQPEMTNNMITTPQLTFFTCIPVLRRLNRCVFTQFMQSYSPSLPPEAASLLTGHLGHEEFCAAWAAQFTCPGRFGAPLLEALVAIHTLALPENAHLIEPALAKLPPGFEIDPRAHPLAQALHLWLIAHHVPDVTFPLPPASTALTGQAALTPPISSPAHAQIPEPKPIPSVESKIEIQNSQTPEVSAQSEIENPNSSTQSQIVNPNSLTQSKIENQNSKFEFPQSEIEIQNSKITSLARLSPPDYDRVRRAQAKRLNIRLRTLDAEVEARRCQLADAEADAMFITPIEPWPEPITDAPELFHQAAERFTLQVVLPPGAADTIALFIGHAHAVNAFQLSPRLNLFSIEGGCGKTTTLDILHAMVPRAMRAENLNPPVIFRGVDKHQPTLILDETDTWIMKDPELRGLLNAGHKAGSHAYRCEGPRKSIRAFKAFAPTILAGIRPLPPTLRDRSITIVLAKPADGQTYLRFNPLKADPEQLLARKLARWAQDSFSALKACDPALPPSASNRLADNWRPLFAVAQVIGGDWPARVARAFDLLNSKHNTAADSPSLALLDDIRLVFARTGAPRLFSSQLAHALRSLPGRPWSDTLNGDKPLSQARLARHLATLGIQGQTLRIGDRITRGYLQSSFMQPLTSDSTPDFEI
ncbi:MAG TPA: DUF3631 domain-containing protein [Verrucomicrobiae bacterium]|nr:DUF3631 domain-containing protein [Verrucomicrobiae bacterium]